MIAALVVVAVFVVSFRIVVAAAVVVPAFLVEVAYDCNFSPCHTYYSGRSMGSYTKYSTLKHSLCLGHRKPSPEMSSWTPSSTSRIRHRGDYGLLYLAMSFSFAFVSTSCLHGRLESCHFRTCSGSGSNNGGSSIVSVYYIT